MMYLFLILIWYKLFNFQWSILISHLSSEKVRWSDLQKPDIFLSSQIPSRSLTGNLILVPQGALMQIKCILNLGPRNYSAVMLQICCLSCAVQQLFQILPKEENIVFLMKWASFGTDDFHPLLSQVGCDCCCSTKF